MHVQVCTLDGCCEHQRTHLRTRSLQDVHMRLCICILFVQRWGNEDTGVQLVYESACCLAWGFIFDRRKDRVFSVNASGSVCGCMCVYTHTHTHIAQMGYSDVSPGVGMRHLEGLKNPDALNLGICIFVCVQSTHVYVYARKRDEILD